MCEIFCFNSNMPKEINTCLQCFYNRSEDHPLSARYDEMDAVLIFDDVFSSLVLSRYLLVSIILPFFSKE